MCFTIKLAESEGNKRSVMESVGTQPTLHIIHEPKVYLLGRQVVDDEALSAFLADHEVSHWSTDTEIGGEKLIETAGRVCFMFFLKPRTRRQQNSTWHN